MRGHAEISVNFSLNKTRNRIRRKGKNEGVRGRGGGEKKRKDGCICVLATSGPPQINYESREKVSRENDKDGDAGPLRREKRERERDRLRRVTERRRQSTVSNSMYPRNSR